jgi:hypothetical protein
VIASDVIAALAAARAGAGGGQAVPRDGGARRVPRVVGGEAR